MKLRHIKEPLIKLIIAPLSHLFSRGVIDGCASNQHFLNYIRIIKTAAGASAAAAIAYALNLDYAVSAGIICLLTIQDTRKETIRITVKRLAAFVFVTFLCNLFFGLMGTSLPVLGAVLGVFLFCCYAFGCMEASAMCSVIATHYFASDDISAQMIINEAILFISGAGMGIILNLFVPSNIVRIRKVQKETDERIKRIIERMSIYIISDDKTGYTGSCFNDTSSLLDSMKAEAVKYIGNSYGKGKDYFLRYSVMRMKQCEVLRRIYTDIMRVRLITAHAEPISAFLRKMSLEFHEMNNAEGLLRDLDELFRHYEASPLPVSRDEFESRALMYHILCDLHYFVSLKADFAATISDREKALFYRK